MRQEVLRHDARNLFEIFKNLLPWIVSTGYSAYSGLDGGVETEVLRISTAFLALECHCWRKKGAVGIVHVQCHFGGCSAENG